jgi:hypothetical protein
MFFVDGMTPADRKKPTMISHPYSIESSETGANLGLYDADSEDAALELYAVDAGYASFSDLAASLGKSVAAARRELTVTAASIRHD